MVPTGLEVVTYDSLDWWGENEDILTHYTDVQKVGCSACFFCNQYVIRKSSHNILDALVFMPEQNPGRSDIKHIYSNIMTVIAYNMCMLVTIIFD